jgi:ubiquinone/menaquinone biosynthesis C-methylase UbiE
MEKPMNERVYNKKADKLRSPERLEMVEAERVVTLCLQDKDIRSILDVGTGSGLFAETFFRRGITVFGMDANAEMIEAARRYLPECTFQVAPAEHIPFGDRSVDAAFFGLVFHEVDDYEKALKEAYRVSRISVFLLEWQYRVQDFGPPLEHRLKPEFLEELSRTCGFSRFEAFVLTHLVLYQLTL